MNGTRTIKALVIDDSAFNRGAISRMLVDGGIVDNVPTVPARKRAPNLTVEIPALLELARERQVPVCGWRS